MSTSGAGAALANAVIAIRGDTTQLRQDILNGLNGLGQAGNNAGGQLGNGLNNGANGGINQLGNNIRREADRAGDEGGRRLTTRLSASVRTGFGSVTTSIGAGLAGGLAGLAAAAGINGLVGSLGGLISDARESAKVGALTEQTIKTMGNQAKITASQVGDLATAISNKTGADDEMIQSGANLLLTFGNIRNEVGKGNDIFNQATQAALDMSTTLGTDMSSASIQLGKALNDPIKGLTALSKSGVSFSAEQQAMVKSMVASGDTLGAQKLILGELEKQFGGSTAAVATNAQKLETVFGNFREQLGGYILPVLDKVQGFIAEKVIPVVASFADEFANSTGKGGQFRAFLSTLVDGAKEVVAFLTPVWDGIRLIGAAIQTLVSGDFTGGGIWAKLGISEDSKVVDGIFDVRDAIGSVVSLTQGNYRGSDLFTKLGISENSKVVDFVFQARDAIKELIGVVSNGARGGGGEGIAVALGVDPGSVDKIVAAASSVRDNVLGMVDNIVGAVQDFYKSKNIGEYFQLAQDLIGGVVGWIQENVVPFFAENLPQYISIFGDVFKLVGIVIKAALDTIQTVIGVAVAGIRVAWSYFGDDIVTIISGAWHIISGVFGGALDIIQGVVRVFIALFTGDWKGLGDALQQVAKGAMSAVGAIFSGAFEILKGVFGAGVSALSAIWDGLKEAAKAPVRFVVNTVLNDGLIDGFNSIARKVAGDDTKLQIGRIKLPAGFADGTEDHRAQIASAGQMRLWAEPETGGEAYIPLAEGKRSRSTEILKKVAQGFGYDLQPFSNGGIIALGKWFQSRGATVSENSAFGGTTPGIHKGAGHAGDYAIDVNKGAGTSASEQSFFDSVVNQVKSWGYKVLWRVAGHFNHLHAETQNAKGGGMVGDASGGSFLSGVSDFLSGLNPVEFLKGQVNDALGGMPVASQLGNILRSVPGALIGAAGDKLKSVVSAATETLKGTFTGDDDTPGGKPSVNRAIVQSLAASRGWGSGAQWTALDKLVNKESGYDNTAQNPTTTAYGMFQFLNGTWAGTGIKKTSDPNKQTEAGLRYIGSRYKDPIGAWDYHLKHNSYDTGGLWPSGTVGVNRSGRNEQVLDGNQTEAFTEAMQAIKNGSTAGNSGALIGQLTMVSSGKPREDIKDVTHVLRRIDRGGGVYGRRRSR